MTTPSDPGSIRDRLKSPVPSEHANAGGDASRSDITDESFQQTDSRAANPRDEGQHAPGPVATPAHHLGHSAELTPKELKVAERKVATLFLLSVVGVLGFIATYIAGDYRFGSAGNPWFTPLLGCFMALALGGIGAGTVLWAKLLMVDDETVQERHPLNSDPADRAEAAQMLRDGLDDTGLKRRPLLLGAMALGAGSLALLPLPLLFGLGRFQHKERALSTTAWRKGMRLHRENGTAVRVGDLQIGAVESVFPDVPDPLMRADSPVLLIRMRPEELQPRPGREDWSPMGYIAYSSVCSHLGCPVKLYEQQTHHLLCPCHQSTFDASKGAKVLFGPAARPLPQLAIAVDDEGYFIAQGDFTQPVGPSYWERGT